MAAPVAKDNSAWVKTLQQPPPPGTPYALPVPGSGTETRSPIYRHWKFVNGPLLETVNPAEQTFHDVFESSVKRLPNKKCLGWRPWNATTKTWEPKYVWLTYAQVAERRKNLGAGIVEIHKAAGIHTDKYGIGLWSQNRPEWQITGQ